MTAEPCSATIDCQGSELQFKVVLFDSEPPSILFSFAHSAVKTLDKVMAENMLVSLMIITLILTGGDRGSVKEISKSASAYPGLVGLKSTSNWIVENGAISPDTTYRFK